MKSYNIVLADDHVIFRQGIKGLIYKKPGLKVIGEVSDGKELLNLLKKLNPNFIPLDSDILVQIPHFIHLPDSKI